MRDELQKSEGINPNPKVRQPSKHKKNRNDPHAHTVQYHPSDDTGTSIDNTPPGAQYSLRSGQAAVTIGRGRGDTIVVTATCDSLSRQVILLEEELTRVRGETVKEQLPPPVSIHNEPTGWQWFQIWTGRIAVAALVLIVIRRRFKKQLTKRK